MKKNLISLIVIISVSFQMTYPQTAPVVPEAKQGKLRMLYQKYGKAKVIGALAAIKRIGPRAIIANYKKAKADFDQADKEHKAALDAWNTCRAGVCAEQKAHWDAARARELQESSSAHIRENRYRFQRYDECVLSHCKSEDERFKRAEQNYRQAEASLIKFNILITVGGTLGLLAASAAVMAAADASGYQGPKSLFGPSRPSGESRAPVSQFYERSRLYQSPEEETEAALKESKKLMQEVGIPVQK